MTQPSTTPLACRGCGAEIFRKKVSGSPPTRCAACLRQDRLISQRGVKQRRREGIKQSSFFTCSGCKGSFRRPHMQGNIPQWCKPCKGEREKERARKRVTEQKTQKLETFLVKGRWGSCKDCGVRISSPFRQSRFQDRCPSCRPVHDRMKAKEYGAKRRRPRRTEFVCKGCGETKLLAPRGSWRIWCPPCGYQRQISEAKRRFAENPEPYLAVRRRNSYRRRFRMKSARYERFDRVDIFERDGWKCGICNKRINKRLKHPHPMSASLDHKLPIVKGGDHVPENTQASHLRCNLRKRESAAPIGEQIPLFL